MRSPAAPRTLDGSAMDDADVVVVGAPEMLSSRDVVHLERFARVRGGAVVFHHADARHAELVGDVLNCSAGILGAAVGAALVLGVQRVRAGRQPRPTAPQRP